jgi:carbon monoxide dehydrogenase subunit G
MRFENEIEVAQPPKELFAFLTDVERVAPCLPGASIDGRDGDDYTGSMRVKVGPITGTYKGRMRFLEQDEDALRAVMSARAAEVNGQGDAEAKITTQIEPAGDDASRIRMETDLQMRGRVAQFGRGAMAKISQRMFDEFARNLEREMAGGDGARAEVAAEPEGEAAAEPQAAAGAEPEGPSQRRPEARPAPAREPAAPTAGDGEALDAMSLFVAPALEKVLPVLGPALIGFGYGYLMGRLRELRR